MNGFIIGLGLLFTFSLSAKTVLFLGDSLTEGYGVPKEKSYPQLIEKKLRGDGIAELKLINGSVSGSTTASGLSRLRWFLKSKPDVLVLALGANDGLRGVKIETTTANLSKVIEFAQAKSVQVLLVGLRMPPNYGEIYTAGFEKMYKKIAKKYNLNFVPTYYVELLELKVSIRKMGFTPMRKDTPRWRKESILTSENFYDFTS